MAQMALRNQQHCSTVGTGGTPESTTLQYCWHRWHSGINNIAVLLAQMTLRNQQHCSTVGTDGTPKSTTLQYCWHRWHSEINNIATLAVLMAQKQTCASSVVPDCKKNSHPVSYKYVHWLKTYKPSRPKDTHTHTIIRVIIPYLYKGARDARKSCGRIELFDAPRHLQHR